jgi:hypothetical protein
VTDDLVKRLREKAFRTETYELVNSAADHIEALEAALVQTFNKMMEDGRRIETLEAALRVYAEEDHWSGDTFEPIRFPEGECKCCYEHFSDQGEIARKALEGKDV